MSTTFAPTTLPTPTALTATVFLPTASPNKTTFAPTFSFTMATSSNVSSTASTTPSTFVTRSIISTITNTLSDSAVAALPSSTQRPPDDTHKANVGVIAGVTSTIGVLTLVVATFCVIRWKQRRRLNNASIAHPLPPPTPPMTESHTLNSTRPSISTTSPHTTAPFDSSVTRSTPPPRKPHQIFSRLERENKNQPSHTETASTVSDENISVNKAEISAMRAEMRAMKTRLAVLEAEVADQPPDYVSSYSSTSRSAR
ncbi:hypothetical protein AAF712_013404 [Marasmius tenuissimus]|uniref:Uncharacterized protein n=1 Tax=Marasmius tenuissimus TaxID=585030 RepID=A0ABR2ZE17_9AGAR